MYGSETWTLYQQEIMQLHTIQQRHLRLILNISNEEVLRRADVEDMEVMLVRTRLRWLGYVCRMNNDKPVKQLLYCELAHGSRPIGRTHASVQGHLQKSFEVRSCLRSVAFNREQQSRMEETHKGSL